MAEKKVEKVEKTKSCVTWERDTKDGRVRVVAKGEKLTPEKRIGTDEMGVEAWQFVQWGGPSWVQLVAEEHLKLLAEEG